MQDVATTRTSLAHSWFINFSQGEPVFDLRAKLAQENDRGDRIRALQQQQPHEDQAWDAPQPPAAKQIRLEHASAGFSSSPRAAPVGPILQIGTLHGKPAVLSQFE